jgi:hypothetical protein
MNDEALSVKVCLYWGISFEKPTFAKFQITSIWTKPFIILRENFKISF